MKRIICTVTNDLTYDQRMQRICSSLSKKYQVTLVGRQLSNSKPLPQKSFQQTRLNCLFNKGKLFYLEYNIRLFFFLLTQQTDAFYAVDLDTILPSYLVSRIRKKPCVYDAHEYFTETPEVVRRRPIQHVWEWVAKFCIPQMSACITVGQGLAEIMGERYKKEFLVVRNVPFRTQRAQSTQRKNGNAKNSTNFSVPILLYQGMLNEGRGLESLIYCAENLEEVKIWIVGEGDLSEELRALVKMLNLEKTVKFWGFVAPDELKSITSQATIGLNLLENKGLSYYYSLANKAFDYVQANIPSIHMDFPEYRRLNKEYEVFSLVPNLEISTLQAAIQQLIHEPESYQQLQRNCARAAAEWNWEREEKKLLHLAKSVFGNKKEG
ncbi:MAG: glycosyltransferase [Bacteroidota bacterium]